MTYNILFTSADTVPQDFAKVRNDLGISQKELGKRINYSQQLISKLETGDRVLHYDQIFEIARAMGVKGVDSMTQDEYRKAAIDAVKQLSIDVKIPQTLAEIGVKEEDLEALTDAAMADVCTGGNPRPCTWEEVLGVYKTAFGK